jgi:hypothetical protein
MCHKSPWPHCLCLLLLLKPQCRWIRNHQHCPRTWSVSRTSAGSSMQRHRLTRPLCRF